MKIKSNPRIHVQSNQQIAIAGYEKHKQHSEKITFKFGISGGTSNPDHNFGH